MRARVDRRGVRMRHSHFTDRTQHAAGDPERGEHAGFGRHGQSPPLRVPRQDVRARAGPEGLLHQQS